MMFKKVIAGLLIVASLMASSLQVLAADASMESAEAPAVEGTSVPAMASEINEGNEQVAAIIADEDGTVLYMNPRFLYFNTLSSSLSQSKGKATCTGTVATDHTQYKFKLVSTLQRSSNGTSWSDQKSWSTAYITGQDRIVLSKNYYLTKGYSYRLITVVYVDTGSYIENADCESNHLEY